MGIFDKLKTAVKETLPEVARSFDASGQSGAIVSRINNLALINGSKLIVGEGQEAVFVRNGQIEAVYGPGKYDLQTDNLPVLKKFISLAYGGTDPNQASIWFVNKTAIMEVEWGTPTPLVLEDKKFGFPITLSIKCNGALTVRVTDTIALFREFFGLGKQLSVDTLDKMIKGLLLSKLQKTFGQYTAQTGVTYVQLQQSAAILEEPFREAVNADLSQYGLFAEHCYVKKLMANEDESWRRYKQYEDKIISAGLDIENEAIRMQRLGYSYTEGRQFDVLETAASKGGGAAIANAGAAVFTGAAMAKQAIRAFDSIQEPKEPSAPADNGFPCPGCGNKCLQNAKFCPECGMSLKPKCPNCGIELQLGAKFCIECGTKMI